MSTHRSSWMTSSVPRPGPTAYSSPALGRMNDIKGRLSFSAMKTPAFKPKQVSLVEQAARAGTSPINGYHMSKQNPDVLDRLCSPSPRRESLLHKKTLTPATVRVGGGGGSVLVAGRGSSHSLAPSSLVKQMLLNDKHRAPSSLVHMATRGRALRTGVNISPVVVKLSGPPAQTLPPTAVPDSVAQTPVNTLENGTGAEQAQSEGAGSSGKKSDPCDKNVVLTALRQRRKRWATSAPDEDHGCSSSSSPHVGAPSAKRTKHSSHGAESLKSPLSYILGDRKRAYTAPSYSMSPDSKKSRFVGPYASDGRTGELPSTNGKRPSAEEECDRESVASELSEGGSQGSARSSKVSSRAPSECIGGLDPEGPRSLTPPVQFDEAEMNRKREESLNNLKAVFSPKGGEKKSSHRRKLPVFCATGTKPHLPTPLSTTHSVTQEDLKKDREAATAKLREILAAGDQPPPKSETTVTTLTKSKALPTNSGARLSSSLSGSLPTLPSATSTARTTLPSVTAASAGFSLATAAVSTSITTSSLPTSSLNTSAAPPLVAPLSLSSTAPLSLSSTPAAPQTQVKSVSFAPLPVPTPTSTTTAAQTSFSFQGPSTGGVTQAPLSNQPATTLNLPVASVTVGNRSSPATGLQPSLSLVSTTSASVTASNITQQVSGPSSGGLVLGAPTLTAATQNQQLSTGLTAASGAQPGLFQSSMSGVPSSALPGLGASAPPQGGGSILGVGTSLIPAPSASTSGEFKFTLPSTSQQQQSQMSNPLFQSTLPPASSSSSSTAPKGSMFGLNAGLQTLNSNSLVSSSSGASGIQFAAQQSQPSQLSAFGGGQAQSSQANGGGVSLGFSQAQAVGGGLATLPNSGLNLNFGAGSSTQQNPPGGSSLSFGVGNPQSSSSGLSLFNNSVKPTQPQQQQQNIQPPPSSSIFGSGPSAVQQQQRQSSSQQLAPAAGFTGFKLSTGVVGGGPQPQGTQLSIFGQSNSAPSGANAGGANLTGGQVGMGNPTKGGSAGSFPSFNVAGRSSGFNFSTGASNTGAGLFQKPGSSSSQPSNSLSTNGSLNGGGGGINFSMGAANSGGNGLFQKALPGQSSTQQLGAAKSSESGSGINFSFSARPQASQQQSSQGLFAFGQKPSGGGGGGGINFPSTGGGNAPSGLGMGASSQSGNGGLGFNFGGASGMGTNSSGTSAGLFNASNVFQSSLQQQPSSQNVFQTPQMQKQTSFTTPGPLNQQNTPTPGGINFQSTPFSFSTGTAGGDSGRPMARARRRKK